MKEKFSGVPLMKELKNLIENKNSNLYKTIVLLLKSEYRNQFFSGSRNTFFKPCFNKIFNTLKYYIENDKPYNFYFENDEIVACNEDRIQIARYDINAFSDLLSRIIEQELHIKSDNKGINDFIIIELQYNKALRESTTQQKEIFFQKRIEYVTLKTKVDDQLYDLETLKKQKELLNQNFFNTFAELLFELEGLKLEHEILGKRKEIKEKFPDLPENEIQTKAEELLENAKNDLITTMENKIRAEVMLSEGGRVATKQEIDDYFKKSKETLTRIKLLLHPDKLIHNPGYHKLSEGQKKVIKELGVKVFEIKKDELATPSVFVGYSNRSLDVLNKMLETVMTIFEFAGMDVENYVIKGNSLEERILWLENEISVLNKILREIKDEVFILINDEEFVNRRFMMNQVQTNPEFYADFKEHLKKEIMRYKEVIRLEKIVNN